MKALIISIIVFLPANLSFAFFSDIPVNHENYDAITYLENLGVVQGYYDYRAYEPDQPINRAEFVKIITVLEYDKQEIENCTAKPLSTPKLFSDVPENEWYSRYVCIARKYDLINGYPDGNFKPAENISFVEAAKIVAIMFGVSPQTAEIWYEPYVEHLSEQNAIPLNITTLDQKVTRGEMAEMIYRLRERVTAKPSNPYDLSAGNITVAESQVQYTVPQIAWQADVDGEVSDMPVISDSTVYLGTSTGYLYVLNLQTGEKEWSFQSIPESSYNQRFLVSSTAEMEPIDPSEYYAIEGKVAIDSENVYFGTNLGQVYALDKDTGKEKWEFAASFPVKNEIQISDNTLIFHDYDRVYTLARTTGKLQWDFEPEYVVQAITLFDDKVYVATKKLFYVLDKNDGKMLWKKEIDTDITSSIVVQGNDIYLGGSDGYMYVLGKDTGEFGQKITTKSPNIYAYYYPVVLDETIYAKRYNYLFALGKSDGQEKWKFQPVGSISQKPIIKANHIFLKDNAGYLYILDSNTGREEERYYFELKKKSGQIFPIVNGEEVTLFGIHNDSIYRFK